MSKEGFGAFKDPAYNAVKEATLKEGESIERYRRYHPFEEIIRREEAWDAFERRLDKQISMLPKEKKSY